MHDQIHLKHGPNLSKLLISVLIANDLTALLSAAVAMQCLGSPLYLSALLPC